MAETQPEDCLERPIEDDACLSGAELEENLKAARAHLQTRLASHVASRPWDWFEGRTDSVCHIATEEGEATEAKLSLFIREPDEGRVSESLLGTLRRVEDDGWTLHQAVYTPSQRGALQDATMSLEERAGHLAELMSRFEWNEDLVDEAEAAFIPFPKGAAMRVDTEPIRYDLLVVIEAETEGGGPCRRAEYARLSSSHDWFVVLDTGHRHCDRFHRW